MKFSRALIVGGFVLLAGLAWAGKWADLSAKLAKTSDDQVATTVEAAELNDLQLSEIIGEFSASHSKAFVAEEAKKARGYVSLRATFEASTNSTDAPAIGNIKQSGLYRKAVSPDTSENWLAKAIDRIAFPSMNLPRNSLSGGPSTAGLSGLATVVWVILGAAVLFLAFLAIRAFAVRGGSKRQVSAMLEDDEPERPLDEWLQLAEKLEAEGKFREAVRCLYVACLLRFDEARVARFDRTQTNWEHFRRISSSPLAPQEFDFRTPTRDFDRIWYGFAYSDASDVQRFRTTYTTLTSVLKKRPAGAAA